VGSSTKRRTTMAKVQREDRLLTKRLEKQARMQARRARKNQDAEIPPTPLTLRPGP
jgi:hypothetical protein